MSLHVRWRSEDNLWVPLLPSNHVDLGDWFQVTRWSLWSGNRKYLQKGRWAAGSKRIHIISNELLDFCSGEQAIICLAVQLHTHGNWFFFFCLREHADAEWLQPQSVISKHYGLVCLAVLSNANSPHKKTKGWNMGACLTPTSRRLRQEDCELKSCLYFMESSKLASVT